MTEKVSISIIGPGKVGVAIGKLARSAGYGITAIAGRSKADAARAAETIGGQTPACAPIEAAGAGGLVLLTVPDDAIRPACEELAGQEAFAAGAVVAHCSGALGSDVLASARESCGCAVGSMHPLQTFPTAAAAIEKMPGTYFFCEGDERAAGVLDRLAADIGGRPVRIEPAAKAAYHAAAAMASNHLVALLDAAIAVAGQARIDPATYLAASEPLIRATAENIATMGPAAALTGPVARGDIETVRMHLEALADAPEDLKQFYRAAAIWTVRLALEKGTIDQSAAQSLRDLLQRHTAGPDGS